MCLHVPILDNSLPLNCFFTFKFQSEVKNILNNEYKRIVTETALTQIQNSYLKIYNDFNRYKEDFCY